MSTSQVAPAAPTASPEGKKGLSWKRILGYIASVVIVVGIFVWAIPKFADYGAVFDCDPDADAARVALARARDALQPRDLLVGEPGRAARHGHRQGGGAHADHDVRREHAAGRWGDRDRVDVLDPQLVGLLRYERRPLRRRDGHLEHLHEARSPGPGARAARAQRAPDAGVHRGRRRRGRRAGDRGQPVRAGVQAASRSRSASATGSRGSSPPSAGCSASRPCRDGARERRISDETRSPWSSTGGSA